MSAAARAFVLGFVLLSGCASDVTGVWPALDVHERLLWGVFDRVHVLVTHPDGVQPSPSALDFFKHEVENVTGKQVTMLVQHAELDRFRGEGNWTKVAIAEAHAALSPSLDHLYHLDGAVFLHVLYVGGDYPFAGEAWYRDELIVHGMRPDLPAYMRPFIENATLLHEFGHMVGLVGLIPETTPRSVAFGSDLHSTMKGSVMYKHDLEEPVTIDFNATPAFDAYDWADIRAFQASEPTWSPEEVEHFWTARPGDTRLRYD